MRSLRIVGGNQRQFAGDAGAARSVFGDFVHGVLNISIVKLILRKHCARARWTTAKRVHVKTEMWRGRRRRPERRDDYQRSQRGPRVNFDALVFKDARAQSR